MPSLLDEVSKPVANTPPPTDFTRIKAALEKIKAAGFNITLQPGDKLLVTPRAKLTDVQVAWITKNKADILAYMRSLVVDTPAVDALNGQFQAKVENIRLMPVYEEPKPAEPVMVRCLDCAHGSKALPGDELAAWRVCAAGKGGQFALKKWLCDGFAAKVAA